RPWRRCASSPRATRTSSRLSAAPILGHVAGDVQRCGWMSQSSTDAVTGAVRLDDEGRTVVALESAGNAPTKLHLGPAVHAKGMKFSGSAFPVSIKSS